MDFSRLFGSECHAINQALIITDMVENNLTDSGGLNVKDDSESIDFRAIVAICVSNWYWFAICVAIALSLGILYILITPPTYTRTASVLTSVAIFIKK